MVVEDVVKVLSMTISIVTATVIAARYYRSRNGREMDDIERRAEDRDRRRDRREKFMRLHSDFRLLTVQADRCPACGEPTTLLVKILDSRPDGTPGLARAECGVCFGLGHAQPFGQMLREFGDYGARMAQPERIRGGGFEVIDHHQTAGIDAASLESSGPNINLRQQTCWRCGGSGSERQGGGRCRQCFGRGHFQLPELSMPNEVIDVGAVIPPAASQPILTPAAPPRESVSDNYNITPTSPMRNCARCDEAVTMIHLPTGLCVRCHDASRATPGPSPTRAGRQINL